MVCCAEFDFLKTNIVFVLCVFLFSVWTGCARYALVCSVGSFLPGLFLFVFDCVAFSLFVFCCLFLFCLLF